MVPYLKLYIKNIGIYFITLSTIVILVAVYIHNTDKQNLFCEQSIDGLKSPPAESKLIKSATNGHFSNSNNIIGMENILDQKNVPTEIPEQWENPLMAILLNDKISPEDRVRKLCEMATTNAKGIPRVQEECLNHLLYTIPDEQSNTFYKLSTNGDIPAKLREDFLEKTLAMRPVSVCVPLCEALRYNQNYTIATLCAKYLQDISKSTNAVRASEYP